MKKVLYSLLASAIVAAFAFISITNDVLPPEKAQATTSSKTEVEKIDITERSGHDGLYIYIVVRTSTGKIKGYHSISTVKVPANVSNSDLSIASLAYFKRNYTGTTFNAVIKDLLDFESNFSTIVNSQEFKSYLEDIACKQAQLKRASEDRIYHYRTTLLCAIPVSELLQ